MSNYELQENGNILTIILSGKIDESSNYSAIKVDAFEKLIVDFNSVTSINSCGIREWINFLLAISNKSVIYKNCSKIIVDQMSSVNEFLTPNTKVESIYLPYYCEDCDLEAVTLHNLSEIYKDNKWIIPEKKCSGCNNDMEFDEVPEIYFQFMKSCKN